MRINELIFLTVIIIMKGSLNRSRTVLFLFKFEVCYRDVNNSSIQKKYVINWKNYFLTHIYVEIGVSKGMLIYIS